MRAVARVLHRAALCAYPAAFRSDFGQELDRVFDERLDGAASRPCAIDLAVYLLCDALISGLAERTRARQERWAWPRHGHHHTDTGSQTMTWESLRADVRLALRQCRNAPLFAALTIASLALGIGASSAMFGVVQAVLLKPLPYAAPGELVMIWSDNTNNGEPNNPVSPANFEAFKAAPSLAAVEGMYSFLTAVEVRIDREPELVMASQVTPGMFALLGRQPLIGSYFDQSVVPGGAVISHQFWQRRFGSDPDVLGRLLAGDAAGEGLPIIAVMPPDFTFPYGSMLGPTGFTRNLSVDVWLAMSPARDWRLRDASGQPNRATHYFSVIGRLAPGSTIDHARSELTAIAAQRGADYRDTNSGWGVTLRPLHEQAVGSVRPALLLLMAGVGVVLLITCINVSNMLLARASARRHDISIRAALGAPRSRLIQQALVESLLLSIGGGVVGLGIMLLTIRATLVVAPADIPRFGEVSPGTPVVLFGAALSLLTGVVVGLVPAAAAGGARARELLRSGTRATASAATRRTRSGLIVAEVALAMTLAIGAGLLLRSFASVLAVDPGFRTEQLLTLQVSVPDRYATNEARVTFYDDLESRLKALPGVLEVGGTTRLPLWSTNVTTMLDVEGRVLASSQMPEVEMRRAVFDYFSAMGIPVVRGRTFTRDDSASQPPVAVVNATLAARVFPGEDPVGKRVRFGSATARWMTIIGVVGDVRHGSLEEAPKPELYVTYRQGTPPVNPFVVVRTDGDATALAGAVRQAIVNLGADAPTDIRTMDAVRSNSVASRRFLLLLVGTFGVLALGLAGLGVFGVITLIAVERTTEVAVRLALGATPSQVLHLVIGHALKLTIAGIVVGAAAALTLGPALESQLFGVRPVDPVTYIAVAVALVLTSGLGALLPARRAMHVDPAHALRN